MRAAYQYLSHLAGTLYVLIILKGARFSPLLIVVDFLSFSKTFRFASFCGDIEKKKKSSSVSLFLEGIQQRYFR